MQDQLMSDQGPLPISWMMEEKQRGEGGARDPGLA